jgi:hypothetical protein
MELSPHNLPCGEGPLERYKSLPSHFLFVRQRAFPWNTQKAGATKQLPLDLLRPLNSEAMEMQEANPKVNNARNNAQECWRES